MLELPAWWSEDGEWRGNVLCEGRASLLKRHVFETWVAGVQHQIEAARDPSFDPGQRLILVPEPDNPRDPNAVAVWNADRTLQAGYIPRVIARDLPPIEGRTGLSLAEYLEGSKRTGLLILVSRVEVSIRPVPRQPDDAPRVRQLVMRSKHTYERVAQAGKDPTDDDPRDPVEAMREMLEDLEGGSAGGD